MRIILALGLAMAVAAAPLEFEVASVRPAGPLTPGQLGVGMHLDGAQLRCTYFSLTDLMDAAFKVRNYQILGPEWLKSDRFDISAKLPEGATREQIPEMLQNLLVDRFKIKMHRETKPLPVYGLIVAKGGLKIKEVPPDPNAPPASDKAPIGMEVQGGRQGVSIKLPQGATFSIGQNRLEAKNLSLKYFADVLSRFMDRPVVDMTGTKGNFDLTLELAPEDFRAMTIRSAIAAGVQLPPEAMRLLDNASDSSLYSALQSLGLKLEPRKAPIEAVVIDSIDKTPTAN